MKVRMLRTTFSARLGFCEVGTVQTVDDETGRRWVWRKIAEVVGLGERAAAVDAKEPEPAEARPADAPQETRASLVRRAQVACVKGYGHMTKAELIEALAARAAP